MSKKGKLLIVDDNTNILSAVKMLTENYEAWVRVYEDFYKKPLVYGES
jgi:hypothetical protein